MGRVLPDERPDVSVAFVTLFGFMMGHALLETARDALFLARLSARQLPWVYLAIALLALAIGQREPRIIRRLSGGSELARWLVAAGVVTVGFWIVAERPWPWVLYALYVWSGVLATLVVVRFWTLVGSRFTLTQAKRIFPLVASGSVAGAITGAATARGLTNFFDARSLVLAAGLVFIVTGRAASRLGGSTARAPAAAPDDLPRLARVIWGAPDLRRVAALVLLATVTFTLIDFVFKSSADRFVPPDQLGEFFASVYLALGVLSLVVQLFGVSWLLRSAGVIATAALVPALLLTMTVGFTVAGGLTAALLLKGADGGMRHSIYRTDTELLFLPLSDRLRARVKGFIDVMGQRGGQAIASIVILMVLSATSQERVFAAIACLTAAGWLVVATGLKSHYLEVFRHTLRQDMRTSTLRAEFPALDVGSLEMLLEALNSPDERRVIAALGVLQDQEKAAVVPTLLLYHPSSGVVMETLAVLQAGRREDAVPMAKGLLTHADPDVRVAALRMVSSLHPEREILEAATSDADPAICAVAEIALVACGWRQVDQALGRLSEALAQADVRVHRAVSLSLQAHAVGSLEPVVVRLLAVDDTDALRAAISAARQMRSPGLVTPLMELLQTRPVRDEIRSALASFGAIGLARMAEALADPKVPNAIKRHLPGAIALVGSPQAPALLLRHLKEESDGLIRFRVLRALGRWRNEQPDLPLDRKLLGDALEQALSTGYRMMEWRSALEDISRKHPEYQTELQAVLIALLRDKQDHALERIFRLLNLQAGTEDFQRLYRGLHSPRDASRAGGRELLHHLVPADVREHLLVLVDDLHGEPDADFRGPGTSERDYARTVAELVGSGMESVSSLAVAHARELGLVTVAEAMASCIPLSEEHRLALSAAQSELAGAEAT